MASGSALVLLLAAVLLCGRADGATGYGMFISYGTADSMSVRMNVETSSAPRSLGTSTGAQPIVTYEPASGPRPFSWINAGATGGFNYMLLTVTDRTLIVNQYVTIDACFSGNNGGVTRNAYAYITIPDATSPITLPISNYFPKNERSGTCVHATIAQANLQNGQNLTLIAASTGSGGITLSGASVGVRVSTSPLFQAPSVLATNKAQYGTRNTMFLYPQSATPKEIGFADTTGMTASTSFESGTPWTFTAVANGNTPGNGPYSWRLTINDETKLANQFMEVDFVCSGSNSPFTAKEVYFMLSINGTGGALTSGKTWTDVDDVTPINAFVPFLIPNRYLRNGAILYLYAFTNSNSQYYLLNSATNLIMTVTTRRNTF